MRKFHHKLMMALWSIAIAGVSGAAVASALSLVEPTDPRGFYIMTIATWAVGMIMISSHYNEVYDDESYHHFMAALWLVIGVFTTIAAAISLAFGVVSIGGTWAAIAGFTMLLSMFWVIYHIQKAGVSRRVD